MPKKSKSKKSHSLKTKTKKKGRVGRRSWMKQVQITDMNKPNGVKENPFIIKNRTISNRVNSIIIGIQQPIVELLGLNKDTWYKQYCDPATKTIFLQVCDTPTT